VSGVLNFLSLCFTPPWKLLPGFWYTILGLSTVEAGLFDAFTGSFILALVIGLIGGFHIGAGFLLIKLGEWLTRAEDGLLRALGCLWSLYGAFIWLSCLGAFVVSVINFLFG